MAKWPKQKRVGILAISVDIAGFLDIAAGTIVPNMVTRPAGSSCRTGAVFYVRQTQSKDITELA